MAEIIRKQVKALSFSLLSPEQIKRISAARIVTPELYDVDGYPVVHLKYIPIMYMFLRSVCQTCNKLLLKQEDANKYNLAERIKKVKDAKKCPHCGAAQEKVKLEKPTTFYFGKKRVFPTEVREILSRISDDDIKLLGVNPRTCRPEWAVITLLLVPSVTVRPSITLETGERSEDDLTH